MLAGTAVVAATMYLVAYAVWPVSVSVRRAGETLEVTNGWLTNAVLSVEVIDALGRSLYRESQRRDFPLIIPVADATQVSQVIIVVEYDRFVPSAMTLRVVPE